MVWFSPRELSTEKLCALGAQGWELVTATSPGNRTGAAFDPFEQTCCVFKRPSW